MKAIKLAEKKGAIVCLVILVLSCISMKSYAAISISGVYQGNSLKMDNPVSDDGFGLSITKVVVNGKIVPLKLNGTLVEIDFTQIGITAGTIVHIAIDYQNSRCPVIYTTNVLSNVLILVDGKEMIGQTDTSLQMPLSECPQLAQKRVINESAIEKPD